MTLPVLVTGDDFVVLVDLTANDLAYVVDAGAEVRACLISLDNRIALSDVVTQSSATAGAAWVTGRVAIVLGAAITAAITSVGLAQIEIQVSQGGGKSTWFAGVRIVKGQIA